MTAHALKLSLGLLFRISSILSLGWGNNRTYLSEEKKVKKNVDDHGSTQNNRKKKAKLSFWSLNYLISIGLVS